MHMCTEWEVGSEECIITFIIFYLSNKMPLPLYIMYNVMYIIHFMILVLVTNYLNAQLSYLILSYGDTGLLGFYSLFPQMVNLTALDLHELTSVSGTVLIPLVTHIDIETISCPNVTQMCISRVYREDASILIKAICIHHVICGSS